MNKAVIIILFIIGAKAGAQTSALNIPDSLAAVGKYNEAIKMLQMTEPKSDQVYLRLAKFQQATGLDQEAIKSYQTVLKRSPGRVLTALDYGEFLLESGKPEQADSLFSRLSEKYPDNAGFVFRLGLVRERKKDSTAIDLFFKTIALDSTHQGALYKTSKHHLQNGQHFNAIKLSSTGLEKRPNNVSLLSILGQAYSVSLQFDKAIPVYEKIMNLGKGSEFILEKLAKAYRLNAQPKQAIETYKKMLDFNDMNSAVHSNLGALYLITDEVDKAQLHITMALLIKKQSIDNEYLNIGLTFKKQGEFEKAFQNFEKAIEDNPENERAILERAIAADAFMKDKESILNLYLAYYNRYKNSGRNDMLSIAEYRIGQLKGEIHQSK